MKAIETRYKGYRFRSRLEARWAVFFDALRIKWDYEPEGFELGFGERYLPDFWLPGFNAGGLYVEVKPEDGDFAKARSFSEKSGKNMLCVFGLPEPRSYLLFEHYDGEMLETDGTFVSKYLNSEYRLYACAGSSDLNDWANIDDAVNAARGARFEFGEQG